MGLPAGITMVNSLSLRCLGSKRAFFLVRRKQKRHFSKEGCFGNYSAELMDIFLLIVLRDSSVSVGILLKCVMCVCVRCVCVCSVCVGVCMRVWCVCMCVCVWCAHYKCL